MEKETHIANLIALSKTDGAVDPHELIFIQSMALRMGLDGAAFQRIVKYPDLVPQRMASTRGEKLHQMAELIVLAGIDHKRSQEEIEFLHKLAAKKGLSAAEIDKLIAHLGNHKMPDSQAELEAIVTG